MDDMHPDEPQDMAMLQQALEPLTAVIQQMLDKMAAMDEEIDALSKLVNEEIIGGITKLYNSKERMAGISGLSEKYGDVMGPYKDFYSELSGGDDIYEKLYEELEEFKQSAEGIDDAAVDAKIQELAGMLKSKFEKIKGLGAEAPAAEAAEEGKPEGAIEVSIEKTSEAPGEDIAEKIRRMKAKAGPNVFGKERN